MNLEGVREKAQSKPFPVHGFLTSLRSPPCRAVWPAAAFRTDPLRCRAAWPLTLQTEAAIAARAAADASEAR